MLLVVATEGPAKASLQQLAVDLGLTELADVDLATGSPTRGRSGTVEA